MGKQVYKILIFIIFIALYNRAGLTAEPVRVFVSIAPQKYFVQQIGKDHVAVQVMVQPGANPATYEPKPRQMAELSKARVYFAIGVPFERIWLKKITAANPKMRVVRTYQGIEKIPMAAPHHHDRAGEHHEEGEHGLREHLGRDPHIWLSPPLVMIQIRSILSALLEVDPIHRAAYEANYKTFISRIMDLDIDLYNIFTGRRGLQFMVFHPAWGYFAQAYGLEQVPIEIEGKNPKPAQLKQLIENARQKGIKTIFVQPQFSTNSAELLAAEIGGQVAFADPLAEDWMTNLREVASKFKEALK